MVIWVVVRGLIIFHLLDNVSFSQDVRQMGNIIVLQSIFNVGRVKCVRSPDCVANVSNSVIFSFFLSFFLLGSLLFSQKEVSYGFEILHGLLSNKNIRIPTQKNVGDPPYPRVMVYLGAQILKKCPRVLKFCMRT